MAVRMLSNGRSAGGGRGALDGLERRGGERVMGVGGEDIIS